MNRRIVFASVACLAIAALCWLRLTSPGMAQPAQAETKGKTGLRQALAQTVTLDFAELPLEDVVERLHKQTKVRFALDSSMTALLKARDAVVNMQNQDPLAPMPSSDAAKDTFVPVGFSCQLRQLPLATALEVFLGHYGLGYALLGDTVVIATAERAGELQRRQPVSVTADRTPLSQVLDQLGQAANLDVVLDPRAAKEAQAPITLKLRDTPMEEAVNLVAELADLKAARLGAVYLVTSPARADALGKSKAAPARMVKISTSPLGGAGMFGMFGGGMLGGGALGGVLPPAIDMTGQGNPNDPFEVALPLAMLQKGGPAPRGPAAAGGEVQPKKAQPVTKASAPASKTRSAVEAITKKLAEPVARFKNVNPMTLKEALGILEKELGFPRLIVNQSSFKEEHPDTPDVYETVVEPGADHGLPGGKLLRKMLDRIQTNNAAYLIRPGYIEIMTVERSLPENQFIEAAFQDVPLDEALAELADLSGVTIVIDTRVGDKARTLVSGRFQQETNLATAVRLLADMADLKLVIVDRTLYITLRSNQAQFPPGRLPPGKVVRDAAA